MRVGLNNKDVVTIEFEDLELLEYKELAETQGWTLRVFVIRALTGYFRLLADVKGP